VQRADVDRVAAVQGVDVAQAEVLRAVEELEHLGIEVSPDATTTDDRLRVRGNSNEQIPVRSPIGGVVLERLVTPGTTVTPGTQLFVVSDLSTLWAVAEIDEALLPRVKAGRRVDVSVAAYPGDTFPGTITFVADLVNPKTRRITVRCTVPNSDGRLKPEMFATVAIGEGEPKPVLVVPATAIQSIDGQPVVFVDREGGKFVPRRITTGASANGQVDVTAGLDAGDRVAVAGSFALKSELLKAGGD
jgi:cobalt-zinc-cadmium efflux system membrane fusion protein